MKKLLSFILIVTMILPAAAASALDISWSDLSYEEIYDVIMQAQHELCSRRDTDARRIEWNGYILDIIDEHFTEDGEGYPCLVIELDLTNNNSDPINMSYGNVSFSVYQSGIECQRNNMYLPDGFDWENSYANVKDGGTIHCFKAIPLNDTENDVEINISLLNTKTWEHSDTLTYIHNFN